MKTTRWFWAFLVCSTLLAGGASADGTRENRSEIYFGLGFLRQPMGGDFDDSRALVYSQGGTIQEILNIPDVGEGFGGRFFAGLRLPVAGVHALGFEVGFGQTRHDADSIVTDAKATLREINLDSKWFFRADRMIQPFVTLGVGASILEVEDASLSTLTLVPVGDATFRGVSLMAGGGAQFYIHPQWSVDVMAGYRHFSFDEAEVDGGDYRELSDELKAGGLTGTVGVSYHFGFGPNRSLAAPAATQPASGAI
jgi:opacity protein-like surface antigen